MRLLRRKRHVSRVVSAVTRNVLLDVNSNALSVINVYNQLKVVAVKDVHRLGGFQRIFGGITWLSGRTEEGNSRHQRIIKVGLELTGTQLPTLGGS